MSAILSIAAVPLAPTSGRSASNFVTISGKEVPDIIEVYAFREATALIVKIEVNGASLSVCPSYRPPNRNSLK